MDRPGMSTNGASKNVSRCAPSGNQPPTFACHWVPVPYTFVTPADESKAIPATGITMARATLNHQDMASSLGQIELNQVVWAAAFGQRVFAFGHGLEAEFFIESHGGIPRTRP